jgi:hypothetical protein
MNAMSQNNPDFAARVARIEAGAKASRQLLYVGADEVYEVPLRVRVIQESSGQAMFRKLGAVFEMLVTLVLGAASHGLAQIGRFVLQGVAAPLASPDLEMLLQFESGFVVATVLGIALGVKWKSRTLFKAIGAGAGVLLFHNAVHQFPELFAAVTSAEWVSSILAHTQAHSILWRGAAIAL